MKITLRKASVVQNRIREILSTIHTAAEVYLNQFEDPDALIKESRATFQKNMEDQIDLQEALYGIRKLAGAANQVAGINDLLTDVAKIEKQRSSYEKLGGLQPRLSRILIEGKINHLKERKDDSTFFDSEFKTGVLTKEEIDEFIAKSQALRTEEQKLKDQLLELNFKTEINLDPTTERILSSWAVL